jgi:peptide deformylase
MAKVLPIVKLPDPVLRKVSDPVERVDAGLIALADDMIETMQKAPGIGLAAIQVGIPRRLVVLDVVEEGKESNPLTLINPEIVRLGDTLRPYEEGCLSIPDVLVDIERPGSLKVAYTGRDGKRHELEAEGLLATAIQHEVDHLDGKLIIDFLSRLRRDLVVRKFRKMAKA